MLTQTKNHAIDWENCRQQLYKKIRYKVYQMKLPRWAGEEDDVAEDVVQDSMRKFLEYLERLEEDEEIQNLESLLYIIALNSLKDRRRREIRLCPETEYDSSFSTDTRAYLSEVATENVYLEGLFYLLAPKIAHFPQKQRSALLADLANVMTFDEKPTPLQAAFLAEGIRLEEYRNYQPNNKQERSRHAALLYQAKLRLKELKNTDIRIYLENEDREKCLA
jgi:DNA-directed RNA polymerase specialized sigma24 family protein